MRQDVKEIIEIPEGIEVNIEDNQITVKSNDKENKKEFDYKKIDVKKEDNSIILESKKASKKEYKVMKTFAAHIRNMLEGIQNNFTYEMEIAFVHFPMTVELSGDKINIKNFLGEKKDRVAKILPGVDVQIDKNKITLTSHDIDAAGQTAANFEKATQIKNRDRRKFQDGLYITKKPRRDILA